MIPSTVTVRVVTEPAEYIKRETKWGGSYLTRAVTTQLVDDQPNLVPPRKKGYTVKLNLNEYDGGARIQIAGIESMLKKGNWIDIPLYTWKDPKTGKIQHYGDAKKPREFKLIHLAAAAPKE